MKKMILYLLAAIVGYPIINFHVLDVSGSEYESRIRILVSGPALILLGVVLMKSNTAKIHRYIGVLIAVLGLIYTGFIINAFQNEV